MRLDTEFFKQVLTGAQCWGRLSGNSSFAIDSRSIERGQIFIALEGNQVDGHDYIQDAIRKGAGGIVMQLNKAALLDAIPTSQKKELFIACVPDVQEALFQLARAWRSQFDIPIIGITGSVGKTSTKMMLSNILKSAGKTYYISRANENTLLGAALNILRMRSEDKGAVFEMGISHRNEMAQLAALIRPTCAIITQIAHSHMAGLGSLSDISQEKRHIFNYLKEDDIGIINGDIPVLSNISYGHPMVRFGLKTTNQVQARKVHITSNTINFTLKLYRHRYKVTLPTNHQGHVVNALAAASIAYMLGISGDIIVAGIEKPLNIAGRFQYLPIKQSNGTLIHDCYNANPESMKAALLAFEKIKAKGKKIAVLGDMLELGITSAFWHRQLGRFLRKVPSLNYVVLVGTHVAAMKATLPVGIKIDHVQSWKEAQDKLHNQLDDKSLVLVKGSWGMKLVELVNTLT